MFAVQAQGKNIRTVEGLGTPDNLHPLQRAFIAHHGLQCGFCTPGFLMLAANALEQHPDIGDEELLDVLSSNLCRCTGYQNIIKAVRAARDEMRGGEGGMSLMALSYVVRHARALCAGIRASLAGLSGLTNKT